MADLKESIADGLKVRRAASDSQDVIRKQEYDSAIGVRPTSTTMQAAIDAVSHDAVTVSATDSITPALTGQALTADLNVPEDTEVQAAGGPDTDSFAHPVVAGDTLTLAKQAVTIASVELYDSGNNLLASGVSGTDYTADAAQGTIYILPDSSLVTAAGQSISVVYTYAQISDGPALAVDAFGVRVNIGAGHNQAARGDHTHTNLHAPASGADTATVSVTVGGGQVISADVRLATSGHLTASSGALGVQDGAYALAIHSHAAATASTPGFMSAADKAKLATLSAEVLNFDDSDTISWSGEAASVKEGGAIKHDESGLAVDFDFVATKNHTHGTVSTSGPGFMSVAQLAQLNSMQYIYFGWADNVLSSGGGAPIGFSNTFVLGKKWLAIKVSTTPITNPQSSDFDGLWWGGWA